MRVKHYPNLDRKLRQVNKVDMAVLKQISWHGRLYIYHITGAKGQYCDCLNLVDKGSAFVNNTV